MNCARVSIVNGVRFENSEQTRCEEGGREVREMREVRGVRGVREVQAPECGVTDSESIEALESGRRTRSSKALSPLLLVLP
jgi:hypothetical protein